MAGKSFVHLHNHSQFSLLDGASKIEELVAQAAKYGMPAVAVTDHGNLFGAILFFEIQDQGIQEEKSLNEVLVPMGRRLGIPLLATNDCHFLNREDHFAHDILICIQTGKTVKDADRMRFTQEHYFKAPEEMWRVFEGLPDAAENTLVVAER